MIPTARKEITESIFVSAFLGVIAKIADWSIPNPLVRSIVVGCLLLGILIALLLPQILRFVSTYNERILRRNLRIQGEIMHHLMHQTRDVCVRSMSVVPAYNPPITAGRTALPHPLLVQNQHEIIRLLRTVVDLFQAVAPPGTKVWACLRDRRGDERYHTFERAGRYNPNRAADSIPMHKDEGTMRLLKERCKSGVCVYITGASKSPMFWKEQENDKYGEDKTVMLGAIMTRSWDSEMNQWSNNKLSWVLGVCANTEDAFDEAHVPLMRTCVDIFSLLANTLLRHDYQEMSIELHERHRN